MALLSVAQSKLQRRFTLLSDRDDGGGDNGGSCCRQPAFLAHPKAVLGRAQREGQREWKLGSSLASQLPFEGVDVVSRIHCQYTRKYRLCRVCQIRRNNNKSAFESRSGRRGFQLRDREINLTGNILKFITHANRDQQLPPLPRPPARPPVIIVNPANVITRLANDVESQSLIRIND